MTLEEYAYLGQLIAAVAVIITLIYLARQVRQANLLARAQTRQRMVEQAQQELYKGMCDEPTIMRSLYKAEPLTETEWIRLSGFLLGAMRQREYEWFQMRDGSIDESLWKAYRRVIAVHLGSTRIRKWWDTWGSIPFDPEFCAMVGSFLEEQPLPEYFEAFERLVADADRGPGGTRVT